MSGRARLAAPLVALAAASGVGLHAAFGVSSAPGRATEPQATFTFTEYFERLGPASMVYTLTNGNRDRIRRVGLRGKNFEIRAIIRVKATSGLAPVCSLSGQPATLLCERFELANRATLTLRLTTFGAGNQAERLVDDGLDDSPSFFPLQVRRAKPRGTFQVLRLAKNRSLIIGENTGYVRFTRIWFFPRKRSVVRVLSFRIVKPRRLLSAAVDPAARGMATGEEPCEVKERKGGGTTTTTASRQEVACDANVDVLNGFRIVLQTFNPLAVDELFGKGADGSVARLSRLGR